MPDVYRLPPDLPIPVDDGRADHLPGRALPSVGLAGTDGRTVALDRLGPGRTVLYLYPMTGRPDRALPPGWDEIPGARGCTPESCAFRDHHGELLEAGASAVYGLSSQDTEYQREVVERLHLPFPLLADPDLALGNRIEHAFYPVFPPDGHAAEVLAWLRAHPARTALVEPTGRSVRSAGERSPRP